MIDYSLTVSGSPWAKNTSEGITLTVPGADMSQLLTVEVDNAAVSSENYSIGADIVLSSAYLQQLASQDHNVKVVFANGSASGSFTVTDPVYYHYGIKSVSGSPWTKNSDATVRIAIDADMSKLSSVEIDGSAADYTLDGDAVVLPASLLQNLSSATHKVIAKFSDGEAETSIEINDPNPIEYTLTVSASPWKKGTGIGLDFTGNADMNKLTSVAVDGTPIANGYGSTGSTLSLTSAYLETLSIGNHSLKLNFSDGFANAAFTVAKADPIEYKIIAVNTSPWVKASPAGISFKIDADAVKFSYEVFVDNNKIPGAAFSTTADRTTVTVSASYLESLSVGKHEISFNFNDGFAKGSFSIEAPAVTPSPTPSPSPISYGFLEGTSTRYIRGSADGMTLKVNADISKFSFLVQIDGNQVSAANYSVTSGSTVVTDSARPSAADFRAKVSVLSMIKPPSYSLTLQKRHPWCRFCFSRDYSSTGASSTGSSSPGMSPMSYSPSSLTESIASSSSTSRMDREMRLASVLTSSTFTRTMSPTFTASSTFAMRVRAHWLMCTRPSRPGSSSTNAPKVVMRTTLPSTTLPTGYFSPATVQGRGWVCL